MSTPIFGCGGIEKWQDAAEYLAVGASAVQICTAAMWNGVQIIEKLTKGLENYLGEHGFSSPDVIKGKALARIGVWNDLDLSWRIIATVDDERCNGCGICATACASGGYQAITMENKKACIDITRCDGCGLCVGVCPTGAVCLRKRE